MVSWHTRHVAPRRFTVPSAGQPGPFLMEKMTDFDERSGSACSQASRPRLRLTENEFRSGIVDLHAGFGQVTVRAQSQMITVALPPPRSCGTSTSGYRLPIRRLASSFIHWA